MKENIRKIDIRLSKNLLEKVQQIAKKEGRSTNAQINYYIEQYIAAFEEKHGKIK